MKKILIATLGLVAFSPLSSAFDFNDIANWTGTGSNRAALAVQWNDGQNPVSLVWGYRYNGTKTGEDMLMAVSSSFASGLYSYTESFGFGLGVYGLGFDTNTNGSRTYITGATPDAAVPTDATDRWQSGWLSNGYWSFWTGASANSLSEASTGVTGYTLQNNDWNALAFAASPNWTSPTPSGFTAAPVPEPASLFILGAGALLLRRKRK